MPGDATFIPSDLFQPGLLVGGLAYSPDVIGGNLYISNGNEILICSGTNGQH